MRPRTYLLIFFVGSIGFLLGNQARTGGSQGTFVDAVDQGSMNAYEDGDITFGMDDKCELFEPTKDYRAAIHAQSISVAFVQVQAVNGYPVHSVNPNEELVTVTPYAETYWYENGYPKKTPVLNEKIPRISLRIVDNSKGKMGLQVCMYDFLPHSKGKVSAIILYHPMSPK